jgi:DNA-binding LacI/PurR family transcriptional regulator
MHKSGASPVTMADVARAAGVSLTTVSRALSGNGRLNLRTRDRVRGVAAELGYHPNPVARRLAGGRSGVIAIAFSLPKPDPGALAGIAYFNDTIHAATQRALAHDYALVVGPPTPHVEVWSRVAVDGVVVVDAIPGDPVVADLRRRGTKLVFIGRDPDGTPEDHCVDADYGPGTRRVLDHLRDCQGRRIGLMTSDLGESFTADCIDAYLAWCAEHGLPPLIGTVPSDRMRSRHGASHAYRAAGAPDALFVLDEVLLQPVCSYLTQRGLRVPDDVLIAVAADGEQYCGSTPVTTLALKAEEAAALAIDALIDLINEYPPVERLQLVSTELRPELSTTGRRSSSAVG